MGPRERLALWWNNRKARKAYEEWMRETGRMKYEDYARLLKYEVAAFLIPFPVLAMSAWAVSLGHAVAWFPVAGSAFGLTVAAWKVQRTRRLMAEALVREVHEL